MSNNVTRYLYQTIERRVYCTQFQILTGGPNNDGMCCNLLHCHLYMQIHVQLTQNKMCTTHNKRISCLNQKRVFIQNILWIHFTRVSFPTDETLICESDELPNYSPDPIFSPSNSSSSPLMCTSVSTDWSRPPQQLQHISWPKRATMMYGAEHAPKKRSSKR